MCGIAGFYHREKDYGENEMHYYLLLERMHQQLQRRGPDDAGVYLTRHCGLSHSRLSIIDISGGHQPMVRTAGGKTCAIVYNGELYNGDELRHMLKERGWTFETTCDTEVILVGFMEFGPEFVQKLNGIFAFAAFDSREETLYLFRDPMGVKPLFYTIQEGELIFASELKGILAHPWVKAEIDQKGFNEIFGIGPARSPGCGVLKGIYEVRPGEFLICRKEGIQKNTYWKLESHPHTDSYERTIETVSFLVQDSIRRQMVSDVPICTFLSGGVDSSLVSAVCAAELGKQGKRLATFSFDFVGNQKNFKANAFQPSQDRPYVKQMAAYIGSKHTFLECDNKHQIEMLYDSVKAHDLPAMADVDSSMLYFCSQVSKTYKVTLTGECADEIFGGYPWFHKEECMKADLFPWTMDLSPRKELLSEEFLDYLQMDTYVSECYHRSVAETPRWEGDSPKEARRREIAYLNLKWFMQTLLNRMDRTSMYSGLEARVPFADTRIIQYVWNVPWQMKAKDGVVKNLLREAGRGLLPEEVLFRRKSPYPKTYDPRYEELLKQMVREIILDGSSPVLQFIDQRKMEEFLSKSSDYGKPWYGQLMAGPQMLAYLLQVDEWMRRYQVQVADR
ncbi:asparagine synthase (glutamine-hydrolyzing) [Lachnospiraceae bacterium 3-1]|nr:asparagine synthase (glutamine-hydrolyzing) [Lachnospiraceae bacterium 3-1]